MNLVSLIMQLLTPDLIGKLASAIGGERNLVQKAAGAAIPGILSGLMGTASKPDGARRIFDALGQQDSGLLGNLGNILGGAGQSGLVSAGTSMLSSLLGGSSANALTSAVGKFAGLGDTGTKTLMGVLGPVVLGALGREQRNSGLDASGLASLLSGQKDNIASALPGDFSKLLAGTDLLGSAGQARDAMKSAARNVTSTAERTYTETSQASSTTNWLPWVAGLALLGLLGWYFLGGSPTQPPATTTTTTATPGKIMAGDVDLTGLVNGTVEGLKTTLGTIKDEASAKAALPTLEKAAADIEKVNGLAGTLQGDGKKGLAALIASAIPVLKPLIDTVLGNSAASAVVKPVLDTIMGKLDTLSKA